MSRKTSCGIAELFPLRFEYVLGVFIALKKQLEDEEKERKKQESEATGDQEFNVNSYTGQANNIMRGATSAMPKIPSMPSMPSLPHI